MKLKFLLLAFSMNMLFSPVQALAQSAFLGASVELATGFEKNSIPDIQGSLNNLTPGFISNSAVTAPGPSSHPSPLLFGLGYNFQVRPEWLIGIGLNYSISSHETNKYQYTAALTNFELYNSNINISNRIDVYIAPSYVFKKDKLIYLKIGYGTARLQALSPARSSDGPANGFTTNPSGTVSGYLLGIGYKQIIDRSFYGFAEGTYANYGHATLTATGTNDADIPQDLKLTVTPSLKTYQLRFGVGYQF